MQGFRLTALLFLFLAAIGSAPGALAAAAPGVARPAQLGGRWNLVLDTPGGAYETPVEFLVDPQGRVAATVLGPLGTFRITDAAGTLRGGKLSLKARTSYGPLKVTARIAGDRLEGKWAPSGIGSLFFKGGLRGLRDRAHAGRPSLEVFDSAWAMFERYFYAPDFNGTDVKALRARYRPQAAAARGEGELVTLMRRMLGELRTSHLDFFATPGDTAELHRADPRLAGPATHGITWRQLSPSIGYLRIESFEDGPAVVGRVDRAFDALGGNESLIVDLRGNGGGTLAAAMRLGDYILPSLQPVGYFASREGLVRRGLTSIDQLERSALAPFTGYDSDDFARQMGEGGALMLMTGGRAARPYRGRVAVLIDEYCFSASEALASVVKETGAATLVGRPTPGLMLGAMPIAVDGGWTLLLPVFDFRTPGGAPVEGRGVVPDIAVKAGKSRKADIAAALKFLKAKGRAAPR